MRDKLKPCPFCGNYEIEIQEVGVTLKCCLCNNCFVVTRLEHTEEEAIAAWNRRVSDED